MNAVDVPDRIERLPIFPLPEVVLFPGAVLPLHVFEPRYLAMLELVLRTDRRMGIAALAPGWEPLYFGAPPLLDVFGLGEVIRHEPAPDGRANILLRGLSRLRLVRELRTPVAFRIVEAERVDDILSSAAELRVANDLVAIRQLVAAFVSKLPRGAQPDLSALFAPTPKPGALVDRIAAAIPAPPQVRQALFELIDVEARSSRLCELLSALATGEPPEDAET